MHVTVVVEAGPDADDEERADATSSLQRELRDSDADVEVTNRTVSAPEGAKGGGWGEFWTGFEITIATGAVHVTVAMVSDWVHRHKKHSIKLLGPDGQTISIPDVPVEDAARILSAWVDASGEDGTQAGKRS
jgi:hypothetical protein